MQPKRFYQHCRSQGIELTMQQAEEMVKSWEDTFSEMKQHRIPLKSKSTKLASKFFGLQPRTQVGEEEEEDPQDKQKQAYMAILKCGQKRDRCSFNSSLNYMFQAEVALGAKLAGWNLVYNGYADRLVAFVH